MSNQGKQFIHPTYGRCEWLKPSTSYEIYRVMDGEHAGRAFTCSAKRAEELNAASPQPAPIAPACPMSGHPLP